MKDQQEQQNSRDEMKIIREVKIQGEAFYAEAKELGNLAADALGEEHRSQITGLESIAESAFTTSEIFDYIKRQTARHEYWWKNDFGKKLLKQLEIELAGKQQSISKNLNINEKTEQRRQERRRIHLLLIRQFIRQMAVEYEFQVSFGKGVRRNGTD